MTHIIIGYEGGGSSPSPTPGGAQLVGLISHRSTSFPSKRIDGSDLENGDYVLVDQAISKPSDLPFVLQGVTISGVEDKPYYFNGSWHPNHASTSKTSNVVLESPGEESLSGLANSQYDVNVENRTKLVEHDNDISEVKSDISNVKGDIFNIKAEVSVIHGDIAGIENDISNMKTDISQAQEDISVLKGNVDDIRSDISEIERNITTLDDNITNIGNTRILELDELPTPATEYNGRWCHCLSTNKMYECKDEEWKELDLGNTGYTSCERLGAYIYKITFDNIPAYEESYNTVLGACSSYIHNYKLYRNFDWKYDNTATFYVITKEYEGIAMIEGLNDESLNNSQLAQLPYHLVDGINRDGIMISAHILYNDFSYSGSGSKSKDIMLLPKYILENLHNIDYITDIRPYLTDLKINNRLLESGYLLQFLVSNGERTYAIVPPIYPESTYDIIDITGLPKLTNFRWINKATIERNDRSLQNRPTGVERWNLIESIEDIEYLRFTECYKNPDRLSEFIGINETTKDSTDEELTEIYNIEHSKYIARERDGETWQTCHSVVYGNKKVEELYCQEDWGNNYISSGSGSQIEVNPIDPATKVLDKLKVDGTTYKLRNTDYEDLTNKPKINNIELTGNVSGETLGLQSRLQVNPVIAATEYLNKIKINDTVYKIDTSTDYQELTNKPSINSIELIGDKSLSDLGIQGTQYTPADAGKTLVVNNEGSLELTNIEDTVNFYALSMDITYAGSSHSAVCYVFEYSIDNGYIYDAHFSHIDYRTNLEVSASGSSYVTSFSIVCSLQDSSLQDFARSACGNFVISVNDSKLVLYGAGNEPSGTKLADFKILRTTNDTIENFKMSARGLFKSDRKLLTGGSSVVKKLFTSGGGGSSSTSELNVSNSSTESISGTASKQDIVNQENKTAIKNLQNAILGVEERLHFLNTGE